MKYYQTQMDNPFCKKGTVINLDKVVTIKKTEITNIGMNKFLSQIDHSIQLNLENGASLTIFTDTSQAKADEFLENFIVKYLRD